MNKPKRELTTLDRLGIAGAIVSAGGLVVWPGILLAEHAYTQGFPALRVYAGDPVGAVVAGLWGAACMGAFFYGTFLVGRG